MVQDLLFRSKFYEIKYKFVRITYSEDQNNIIKFKAKLLLKTNLIICISETRQKAKVFRLVSLSFLKSSLQLVTLSNIKVHFYFIWTKIN
jgi:hypothetical protein